MHFFVALILRSRKLHFTNPALSTSGKMSGMFLFSLRRFLTGTGWHQPFHFFFKPRPLSSPWSSAQYSVVARVRCCVPMHPKQGSGLFVEESSVSRKLKILSRPGRRVTGDALVHARWTRAPSRPSLGHTETPEDRSSIPALPIEFRSPVESSAICIPGMIARCRRLRARASGQFPLAGPGHRSGDKGEKGKTVSFNGYLCRTFARTLQIESRSCERKWKMSDRARNRSEIEENKRNARTGEW